MGALYTDEEWAKHNGITITDPDTGEKQFVSANDMTPAMRNAISPSNELAAIGMNKLYKQADGSYANTIDKSLIGVSLDKKNKKVQISAPQVFLDSDYYKGTDTTTGYKDVLSAVEAMYKANPDKAFALEKDGEKKTAEDWIKELNSDISKFAGGYYDSDMERLKANFYSNVSYSMDDWRRRQQIATSYKPTDEDIAKGIADTSTDNTMIAIPKWFGVSYLEGVEGYDAEKGVISKGDFQNNFWNSTNLTDDQIKRIGLEVQRRAESGMDKNDMSEYAANQALYDTLRGVSFGKSSSGLSAREEDRASRYFGIGTKRDGLTSIADTAKSVFQAGAYGIGKGSANMITGLLTFVGGIFDTTSDMFTGAIDITADVAGGRTPDYEYGKKTMTHTLTDWAVDALKTSDEWFDDAQNAFTFVSPQIASVNAVSASVGQLLSEAALSHFILQGATGVVAATRDLFLESTAVAAGESATKELAQQYATKVTKDVTTFTDLPNGAVMIEGAEVVQATQSEAEFGAAVATMANSLREAGFTDAVAKTALSAAYAGEKAIPGIAKASGIMAGVLDADKAAMISAATRAVTDAATKGEQIAKAFRVAQSLTELSSIAYIGASVADPVAFHRVMTSKEISNQDKAYLTSALITSAAWYTAGVGLGWFGNKTGITANVKNVLNDWGTKRAAATAHFANRFNYKVNQFTDWLHSVIKGGSADASTAFRESMAARNTMATGGKAWEKANKAAASAYYNVVRQAEAKMMDEAWKTFKTAKTAAEVNDARLVVQSVDNMISDINQGSDKILSAMYDVNYNPAYAKANNDFMDAYSALAQKTSNISGLTQTQNAISVDKSGVANGVAGAMPVEVNDYVTASLSLPQQLDNYISAVYPGTYRTDAQYRFALDGKVEASLPTADPIAGEGVTTVTLDDIRKWSSSTADRIESDLEKINKLQDMANNGQIPQSVVDDAKALVDKALRVFQVRSSNGIITQGLAPDIPGYNHPIVNAKDLRGVIDSGAFGKNGEDYFPLRMINETPIDMKNNGRFESDYTRLQKELDYSRRGGKVDHYQDVSVTLIGKQMDDAYYMSVANVISTAKENLPGLFTDVKATPDEVLGAKYAKQRSKITKSFSKMLEQYANPKKTTKVETKDLLNQDYPITERASVAALPDSEIQASFYGNPVKRAERRAETVFKSDIQVDQMDLINTAMNLPASEKAALLPEYEPVEFALGTDGHIVNSSYIDNLRAARGGYSKEMTDALNMFEQGKGPDTNPINDVLKARAAGETAIDKYDAEINALIGNIRYSSNKPFKVYHGSDVSREGLVAGGYVNVPEFLSTSVAESVSDDFAKDGGTLFELTVPAGTPFGFTTTASEEELMFHPGSGIRIDGFSEDGKIVYGTIESTNWEVNDLIETSYVKDMAKWEKAEKALAKRQGEYSDIVERFGEGYGEADTDVMLKAADDVANNLIEDLKLGSHGENSAILSAEVTGADNFKADLVADYRAAQYLLGGKNADGEKMVLRNSLRESLKEGITKVNERRIDEAAKLRDKAKGTNAYPELPEEIKTMSTDIMNLRGLNHAKPPVINADGTVEYNPLVKRIYEKYGYDTSTIIDAAAVDADLEERLTRLRALEDGSVVKGKLKDATVKALKVKAAKDTDAFIDAVERSLQEKVAERGETLKALHSDIPEKNTDLMDELSRLVEDITGLQQSANIISTVDGELIEVDPLIADLINFKPVVSAPSTVQQIRQWESKVFRYGTTTINPSSIINQYFKDPISAIVNGNLDFFIYGSHDSIAAQFGEEFAAEMDKMAPEIIGYMKQTYGEGNDLYKALEQRYAGILRSNVGGTTEVSSYQFRRDQKRASLLRRGMAKKKGAANVTKEWLGDAGEKINNILETPSRFREEKLREGVGMTNFRDALAKGYTVEQAYTHARWTMDNATTNFGRSSYWWHNFTSSIPYANAAFNGFKSFNKMFALDPVGIMSRMFSGLILPAMFFTIQNLGSEENRKVYDNLPEWQRASGLVVIIGGHAYTVPLPEQMTALISPWRHAVELLYGANKAAFWKLALNDLFDFMPIDMTGFMGIDSVNLLADDQDYVAKYINSGFSKMASSLLSPIEKSIVMYSTGYDPYTNMPINPGYVTLDEDGNAVVMSSNATNLGQTVSNLFGGVVSPGMAQKVLESLIGKANTGILDGIVTLGKGVKDGDMGKAGNYIVSGFAKSLANPVTAETYNRTSSAFNSYVNVLKQKKAQLLSDSKIQAYIQTANSTTASADERAKAKAKVSDALNGYYGQVLTLVNNYLDKTGAQGLTRNQFASVLQLMNMETGGSTSSLLSPENSYLANIDSDQFKSGRASAIQTMADMGFAGTLDSSIFGYYKQNQDGTYDLVYSDPISILDYNYTDWRQSALINDRLDKATKDNNLYEGYQSVNNRLTGLYAKKDYDAVNELELTWNGQVMAAYKDIIDELSADAVLGSNDAIDEIGRYMFVPYSYSKGARLPNGGSKKRAYIRNYVKYIYGVQ